MTASPTTIRRASGTSSPATSTKQRKRVDLNIYPPDLATGVVTGDAFRLIANALVYQ
jgi:hypothetical protein